MAENNVPNPNPGQTPDDLIGEIEEIITQSPDSVQNPSDLIRHLERIIFRLASLPNSEYYDMVQGHDRYVPYHNPGDPIGGLIGQIEEIITGSPDSVLYPDDLISRLRRIIDRLHVLQNSRFGSDSGYASGLSSEHEGQT